MNKILATAVLIIIEAGIEVLAEQIKKRRNRNGNPDGLDHFRNRRGAYDLHDRSTAQLHPVGDRGRVSRSRRRRRSISWE